MELLNKKESKLKDLKKIQPIHTAKKRVREREIVWQRKGVGVWPCSLVMRRPVQMGASGPVSQLIRSQELCPTGKEGGTTGPSETGGKKYSQKGLFWTFKSQGVY